MALRCAQYVYLLSSLLVATIFVLLRIHSLSVYVGADLAQLVYGSAHLPYQYRVLVPALVRGVAELNLVPLFQLLCAPLDLRALAVSLDTTPEIAAPFVVFEILSVLGILLSFRALMKQLISSEGFSLIGAVMLLSLLYALPLLTEESRLWYPSDMPAVLVVILSYLFLLFGKLPYFYAVFLLGSFNRESTVFLLPVLFFFPVSTLKSSWAMYHTTILLGCWLVIKWFLFQMFRENAGYPLHPNIFINVELLSKSGALGITLVGLLLSLVMYWLIIVRFKEYRLRSAFLGLGALLVCTFFAGKWDEMRVYFECMPLLVSASILAITPRPGRVLVAGVDGDG